MAARMTFGEALEALKAGKRVARDGWGGGGAWLLLITDWTVEERHGADVAGTFAAPWIGLKTTKNNFGPWTAAQADILTMDWRVVE